MGGTLEIGLIIAAALAIGRGLKAADGFPNSLIPAAIVVLTVVFNLANVALFGDSTAAAFTDAARLAIIEAFSAIGIYSGVKNTVQRRGEAK